MWSWGASQAFAHSCSANMCTHEGAAPDQKVGMALPHRQHSRQCRHPDRSGHVLRARATQAQQHPMVAAQSSSGGHPPTLAVSSFPHPENRAPHVCGAGVTVSEVYNDAENHPFG